MTRLKALDTGPWTAAGTLGPQPLAELAPRAAKWGYEGLQLAFSPDHFDLTAAVGDPDYCGNVLDTLKSHGLDCRSLRLGPVGHLLFSPVLFNHGDDPTDRWAPDELAGNPRGKSDYAAAQLVRSAEAAKNLGVDVVCACVGNPLPTVDGPVPMDAALRRELRDGAVQEMDRIFAAFEQHDVRLALTVAPGQFAHDIASARALLDLIDRPERVGLEFRPADLHWQGADSARFAAELGEHVFAVTVADASILLDGRTGILGGPEAPGWEYRSPGRGGVDWEAVARALARCGYDGPLTVDWADPVLDPEFGLADAAAFLQRLDLPGA